MDSKIQAAEYLLRKMGIWKAQLLRIPLSRELFSRTQMLKMLFLASAIKRDERDLLDVFDNFYAMQFGPVESDVMNSIEDIDITNARSELPEAIKIRIDSSIEALREVSPLLVLKSASEMVEITHKWRCWHDAFLLASDLGKGSIRMGKEQIRQSNQLFV